MLPCVYAMISYVCEKINNDRHKLISCFHCSICNSSQSSIFLLQARFRILHLWRYKFCFCGFSLCACSRISVIHSYPHPLRGSLHDNPWQHSVGAAPSSISALTLHELPPARHLVCRSGLSNSFADLQTKSLSHV